MQTAIVLIALIIANTGIAQTNNTVVMGASKLLRTTVRADGKLEVHKNGVAQFKNLDDLFCLLVTQGNLSQRYRTANDNLQDFTNLTLSDLASQTTGRLQYISKRCSATFDKRNFHVDYTLSYDTLNPDIITHSVKIDASQLASTARISIAFGFDINFGGNCNAGGAFIAPNNENRNYNAAFVNVTVPEMQEMKFFGGKSIKYGKQLKGFMSISRPFSLGSVQGYTENKAATFLDKTSSGMIFHNTYDLSNSECRTPVYDLGVACMYKNINGATVTDIQTGMLFTDDIAGGLDYSWTNSFSASNIHKQITVGEVADLNIRYFNYLKMNIYNMQFDVNLGELTIAGKCSTQYINGQSNCATGTSAYSLRNASLDALYVNVIIPVRAPHAGIYTLDVSAFSNTSKALPAGRAAILTVNSEVNFSQSRLYPTPGNEVAVRVELPAGTTEPQDTKVVLKYSHDTARFTPRPDTVVIPAGRTFTEFMLRTPAGLNVDTKMDIEIAGTDNPYIKTGAVNIMQILICRAVLLDDVAVGGSGRTLIDPMANDLMLPCDRADITIDTANVHLRQGNLTVNPDKTITYSAAQGTVHAGIDSFRYVVSCPTPSIPECNNDTWVYIVTPQAVAGKYIACPNAEMTVAMTHIAGVEYHWYDARAGGNLIRANSDSCLTRKSNAQADTLFVEAEYKGMRLPRYALVIERSEYCSDTPPPSSCASAGRVIFVDDFGGNSAGSPAASTVPLPNESTEYIADTLQHQLDIPGENRYGISKIIADSNRWHTYSDHTSAAANEGYLMAVNGTDGRRLIYRAKIDSLCAGQPLNVSAWIGNLLKPDPNTSPLYPRMVFTVHDLATNRLLAEYATGDIPAETSPVWKIYGYGFVPEGNSILLSIFSHTTAGSAEGNDFVIDDIELRLCTPPVEFIPSADTGVCSGSNVSLNVSYTDNGIFPLPLTVRWEYSPANTSAWTVLRNDTVHSVALAATHNISPFTGANAGNYRAIIGNSSVIDHPRCRVEQTVKIDTVRLFHASDIRIRPLAEEIYDTTLINLSKYIDIAGRKYVEWEKNPVYDPDIVDSATGSIEAYRLNPNTVYTYRYRLNAPCNISTGKAYVKLDSLPNWTPKRTKTLVVCRSDESSSAIILENVAGVSADGSWTSKTPDPNEVIKKTLSNDNEYSSNIFNAQKAYDEAQDPVYNDTYEGKQAKVITLTLEVPVSANAPDEIMDLKIVITDF